MSMLRNTFEGGTNGLGITLANSGGASGDPFNAVDAAQIYSNAHVHEGTLSGTGPTSPNLWIWNFTEERNLALRGYFWLSAPNAGGNSDLFSLYFGAGTAFATFRVTSQNLIRIYHAPSTGFIWSPDQAMPVGQWVRAEVLFEQGVTANDGRMRAAIYAVNSPTPIADSGWITGLNLRGAEATSRPNRVRIATFRPEAGTVWVDSLAVNTGVDYTGFIGASTPELPTPLVTVIGKTAPTAIGATDGSITFAWPPVEGADRYESAIATGDVSEGFVADDMDAVSPKTYTGLAAGVYTVAVRARV